MNEGFLKKHAKRTLAYLFLILASLISIFPLYWSFISAFNNTAEILGGRMLPSTHFAENLKNLFAQQNVGRAMKNSLVNSLLQTFLALLVSSVAGYGFEVYHDKGKDAVMRILMLAMMVSNLKLLNTVVGFVLPGISTPFLIMFFRNSARSFPHDIIEAARIDGLNEVQIFARMFVPVMRPTYAAAATITFMNAWNSYLWPKVIMQTNESTTMPMLVSNLMAGYVIDYGVVMMGVTICSLPTVIIFFLLQKSFTESIAGSVK